MDIIIKSFNRPYYLDRCITTVKRYVKGYGRILILDDGTPQRYLNKIKCRHPEVEVRLSEHYLDKSASVETALSNGGSAGCRDIPWSFWIDGVRSASDYFVLLEDDQWLLADLDVQELEKIFVAENIVHMRLSQTQCPAFENLIISDKVSGTMPWFLVNWVKRIFFLVFTEGYSKPLCKLIGCNVQEWELNAYALYTVSAAIFAKRYWLYACEGAGNKIDESLQIRRSVRWAMLHPSAKFGRAACDTVTTTFRSSVSSDLLDVRVGFSMPVFNRILNESWLRGELEPCDGMPGDFPSERILSILENAQDSRCTVNNWRNWCNAFGGSYQEMGLLIE